MENNKVILPDISCGHCLSTVQRELTEMEGIQSVTGDVESKVVEIIWSAPATWSGIISLLEEIGYPPKS
ncbi:MAG: heavy metal-associated domain-containing protein [Candidatus Electryonea clarkiae]|nr:heavy metal-associated domain-containing protein [Candidatus Electryonea clarkiae]MDP8285715.1 heavy metal-associated domain-containing protein [Candidatus Electryonea clarkiae]